MNDLHIENHMVLPEAAPNEPPEATDREIEEATNEILEQMLRVGQERAFTEWGTGDSWVNEALCEPTIPLLRKLATLVRQGVRTGRTDNAEIGKLIREHIVGYIRETAVFAERLGGQIARDRQDKREQARADEEFEADD